MLSNKKELENVVEGILFVSGQGVKIEDISSKLKVSDDDVRQAIENLKEKHKDDGINVITYSSSAQLSSNPKYFEDISTVLNPIKEKLLTKATLETVAIIAYKQPVTRLDIERVRGVNSDYAIQVLMNFKLVQILGRKNTVGKPLLFGTTDEFLKKFNLQSIKDLPDYDSLLNRIKVLYEETDTALYTHPEVPKEEVTKEFTKKKDQTKDTDDNPRDVLSSKDEGVL